MVVVRRWSAVVFVVLALVGARVQASPRVPAPFLEVAMDELRACLRWPDPGEAVLRRRAELFLATLDAWQGEAGAPADLVTLGTLVGRLHLVELRPADALDVADRTLGVARACLPPQDERRLDAEFLRAEVLQVLGRTDELRRCLQEVADGLEGHDEVAGRRIDALVSLYSALVEAGRRVEAAAVVGAVGKVAQAADGRRGEYRLVPRAVLLEASHRRRVGDVEASSRLLAEVSRRLANPGAPAGDWLERARVLVDLGVCHERAGNPTEAAAAFDRVLAVLVDEAPPPDPEPLIVRSLELARWLRGRGDLPRARRVERRMEAVALSAPPTPTTTDGWLTCHDSCVRVLQTYYLDADTSAYAEFASRSRPSADGAVADATVTVDQTRVDVLLDRARTELDGGSPLTAEASVSEALGELAGCEESPDTARRFVQAAGLLGRARQTDRAANLYRQALEILERDGTVDREGRQKVARACARALDAARRGPEAEALRRTYGVE